MATKSILKQIKINERCLAHTFAEALDKAEHIKYKPKKISRKCTEITGDEVRSFFDD